MRRMLTLLTALALLCAPGALGEAALPEPEAVTGEMILGEAEAEYFYEATLYYVGTDGLSLSQATRTLLVRAGTTLPETALEALFDSSGSLAQAAVAPADTRAVWAEKLRIKSSPAAWPRWTCPSRRATCRASRSCF